MSKQTTRLTALAILLTGWTVFLWAIQRDLPYEPFIDEPIFVERAIHMAATGDLNPHWFGNPGSTTIYPLVALYRVWFAATEAGSLLRPDPRLEIDFSVDFSIYYLVGRLLTVVYGLLTVAVTFALGKKAWGVRVGILASLFLVFYPTLAWHTTVVRTDTSAMFFVALALWYSCQAADQPRLRNFVLGGAAIGLALSSRYLMVPIYFVYVAFFLLQAPHWRRQGQFTPALRSLLMGMLVSGLTFALTSPFFFLDWNTAWENLLLEARSTHVGADGKNYLERVFWYLTSAVPGSVYGGQLMALLIGVGWSIRQRQWRILVLAGFVLIYVATISIPALHWKRWTIQISPVLALLAAYGVARTMDALTRHSSLRLRTVALVLVGGAVLIQPAYATALVVARLGSTSTRIEARHWIQENLPSDSRFIAELYTAPLQGTSFTVIQQPLLPEHPYAYYVMNDFDDTAGLSYSFITLG